MGMFYNTKWRLSWFVFLIRHYNYSDRPSVLPCLKAHTGTNELFMNLRRNMKKTQRESQSNVFQHQSTLYFIRVLAVQFIVY